MTHDEINVMIDNDDNITIVLDEDIGITGVIDTGINLHPDYRGPYRVIPSTQEQILDTNDKIMKDDVTVEEIPYFETANEYGYTIYIG